MTTRNTAKKRRKSVPRERNPMTKTMRALLMKMPPTTTMMIMKSPNSLFLRK